MNKVKLERTTDSPSYWPGEMFKDAGGCVYLLCEISDKRFSAVSLRDGNRWLEPTASTKAAVKDLEFLGHGKMIIEY